MNRDDVIQIHLDNLRKLIVSNGLFLASANDVNTKYNKVWPRDNMYEALAFEAVGEWEVVQRTYHSLLDIYKKYIDKIEWAAGHRPTRARQYICSRYDPESLDEVWEGGNKQYDSIGAVLFKLGDFEVRGKSMLRDDADRRSIQALINYLTNNEYWHDPDSGMWEENEELHSSSVGSVLAALKKWRDVGGMRVGQTAIENGEAALRDLLPRETQTRFVDLALLSLIYPYDIVDHAVARTILQNVSYHLERDRGVIRYKSDRYYNKNTDGYSEEAEWCFGLPWLALAFKQVGDLDKFREYTHKMAATVTADNKIPELYMSHSGESNPNTPLGWAESLYIVAYHELGASRRTT